MMVQNLFSVVKRRFAKAVPLSGLMTELNPYSYVIARQHAELFDRFDNITFDGIGLQVGMRLLGVKSPRRISFDMSSMAGDLFRHAASNRLGVYFIGTTENAIHKAVKSIEGHFPGLRVAGCRNGYFADAAERDQVLTELAGVSPDIVIVGMGTPLQEQFLVDLRDKGWTGSGFTCGGFLHQTASHGMRYYPEWINALQLRWLYRMCDEPGRLIKRYATSYPLFGVLLVWDWGRQLFKASTGEAESSCVQIEASGRDWRHLDDSAHGQCSESSDANGSPCQQVTPIERCA